MEAARRELPQYRCHKKVSALKIAGIERDADGSAMITPADEGFAPFRVDHEYMHKHKPQVGGYYVVYKDGYKSFWPAEAFEDGYDPEELARSPFYRYLFTLGVR